MTLQDMAMAQENIRAKLAAEKEAGVAEAPHEVARDAQQILDLRQWQQLLTTERFVNDLQAKIEDLDQQAKNLAMLDTDCALAIRALLIESATLKKVINYARRIDHTTAC